MKYMPCNGRKNGRRCHPYVASDAMLLMRRMINWRSIVGVSTVAKANGKWISGRWYRSCRQMKRRKTCEQRLQRYCICCDSSDQRSPPALSRPEPSHLVPSNTQYHSCLTNERGIFPFRASARLHALMIDVQCAISLLTGSKRFAGRALSYSMSQPSSSRRMPHAFAPGALVERIGELVEDGLRRPFRRKQDVPGRWPKVGQASFGSLLGHCSEIARNRLKFAKNHPRGAPLNVRRGIEAIIDVIVNKPPLRLADGLLDGIQLLRQRNAAPTFIEHRDYSAKMTLRPLKTFDIIRVSFGHMSF
jgi:hypothetical protein